MGGGLGGNLARFLSEKLGEEAGHRATRGEAKTDREDPLGTAAVEVGDQAGFELRDRVVEALDLYCHEAEHLESALRQALVRYDRAVLGDPTRRYPGAR